MSLKKIYAFVSHIHAGCNENHTMTKIRRNLKVIQQQNTFKTIERN